MLFIFSSFLLCQYFRMKDNSIETFKLIRFVEAAKDTMTIFAEG